jgi:hypothetical protein
LGEVTYRLKIILPELIHRDDGERTAFGQGSMLLDYGAGKSKESFYVLWYYHSENLSHDFWFLCITRISRHLFWSCGFIISELIFPLISNPVPEQHKPYFTGLPEGYGKIKNDFYR